MICWRAGSSSISARGLYSEVAWTVRRTRSSPRAISPCQAPSGKMVERGTQRTSSASCARLRRDPTARVPATVLGTERILSPAMPELPEVESLCRSFDARLRGRIVERMSVRSVAVLKTFDPPASALDGLAFDGCVRRGKFIDLVVPPLHLVVHLARGGWIRLRDTPTNARPALRGPLAVIVTLSDGGSLEITEHGTDKRLAVSVVRDPTEVPGIARTRDRRARSCAHPDGAWRDPPPPARNSQERSRRPSGHRRDRQRVLRRDSARGTALALPPRRCPWQRGAGPPRGCGPRRAQRGGHRCGGHRPHPAQGWKAGVDARPRPHRTAVLRLR